MEKDTITMDIEDVWRLMKHGIAMRNYVATRRLLNDIIDQHQKDPTIFTLESLKGADAPSEAGPLSRDGALKIITPLGREGQKVLLKTLMEEMNSSDAEEVLEEEGWFPD